MELERTVPASDENEATARTHLSGREAQAASSGSPAPLSRGTVMGRYVLLDMLGAGGMGMVYAAYDPELDRKVALKLLLPSDGDTDAGRTRLLREAQALARLTHPNVVAVYDVGTHDDQVWIAMEFVPGQTLGSWARARPRRWPEVLGVLTEIARGVAAAHAVGLVHRDLKPDNVMIGSDGRVRVMDFGLAHGRTLAAPVASGAGPSLSRDVVLSQTLPAEAHVQPELAALALRLTRGGAVQGTPAYMAPEQWRGEEATPAVDQFGWAVMASEMLYGERPFDGQDMVTLATNVLAGQRRSPPRARRIPGWLARILARALHTDPSRRFSGMDALLAEVHRRRYQGRNRWLALGVSAGLATVLGVAWATRGEPPTPCAGGPERMTGVWDDATRAQAEQAFLTTHKLFAADAWAGAAREVDAYANRWLTMHRESCEATLVRGEQSAELMDLRAACLTSRLRELKALTTLYGQADATVAKQAVTAAMALPPLDGCADAAALRDTNTPPPADQAAAVAALQERLAAARALRAAGKQKDSLAALTPILAEAETLDYAPLVAHARMAVGQAQRHAGEYETAVVTLRKAAAQLLVVRDDEELLTALLSLEVLLGNALARDVEATPWFELASAMVERRGNRPHEVAQALLVHASVDVAAQRFTAAEAQLVEGIRLIATERGPEHPSLVQYLSLLGGVYLRTGKYEESQAQLERAVALAVAAGGPNHPEVVAPLNSLALSFERQARYDDAIAALRQALGIIERAVGTDHPNVGLLRQNIGGMLRLAGKPTEARVELDAARQIVEAKLGPEHPHLATALTLSGDLALEQGDLTRARADYERSDALRRKALGEQHPERSLSLLGLGRLALAEHRPADAAAALEKALALMATTQPDPVDQAEVKSHLAEALPASARTRARLLASEARQVFVGNGVRSARELAKVDAWLAANP